MLEEEVSNIFDESQRELTSQFNNQNYYNLDGLQRLKTRFM